MPYFIRVEYSKTEPGSTFKGVGDFINIPLDEAAADGVETVFERMTGLTHLNIIFWNSDEVVDHDGNYVMNPLLK